MVSILYGSVSPLRQEASGQALKIPKDLLLPQSPAFQSILDEAMPTIFVVSKILEGNLNSNLGSYVHIKVLGLIPDILRKQKILCLR